jgi:Zn-dependent protease
MGWEDREYAADSDRGQRLRRVLRRIFGDGEDFFNWGVPLYRAWGIQVRLHLLFILIVGAELIGAIPQKSVGFSFVLIGMVGLFGLVLLHEYGHCFACRRVGGTADRIVLWPLGGLASCDPPPNWRDNLITTLGGPAVNAALLPVFGAVLLAVGAGWDAVVFNPLRVDLALGGLALRDGTQPYWLVTLWWLHYTNLILLAFNMLLPMYPMDCGRVVHALLWRRLGYGKATDIVTKMGLGAAVVLLVLSMVVFKETRLMGVAIFCGITCWYERRRMAMTAGDPALAGYDFSRGYAGLPAGDDEEELPRRNKALERRKRKEEEEQAELDRILAKIAKSGMGSLTKNEKKWLTRATEKRRGV